MATTKTRKTPAAVIAKLREETESLQGVDFGTLKPKLTTLVGALETLQKGDRATKSQRAAVVEAIESVKADPAFPRSNGVTSALDFVTTLKRLHGEGGISLKPAEIAQEAVKPATAEKIEAIESASSRVLGIRQTMDSKVNQDVFELTGNFVTIANKWAGSQTRNASKPAKLEASNLALSEAIWELQELGENLLAEYGLKEIVGELVNLHGAQKPEKPFPRAHAVEIAPRVVPVALDSRNTESLSQDIDAASDAHPASGLKTRLLKLGQNIEAYQESLKEKALDEETKGLLAFSASLKSKIGEWTHYLSDPQELARISENMDQYIQDARNSFNYEEKLAALIQELDAIKTSVTKLVPDNSKTADLPESARYSEAELTSRLAAALDIDLNAGAPKTAFDELHEKLSSYPFLDNLNYSHGIDRETIDQAIVYLAAQEQGERAARGLLNSFTDTEVTFDERGNKNGYTKCALFLIATNHVMRNKINKTDHYKKLRDSLIAEMATTVPPSLEDFVPASSPLPASGETLAFTSRDAESAADTLDFDTLLKEYVRDDLVADDVLFFINDQQNAEALKTALKNALTNPAENAVILATLDDSISLVEYIRNCESLEERMLARLNGAEDTLEDSEVSYLRNTLQPKLGENEAAAISAAIDGRNFEGAANAVAAIMLKQRELFSQEIAEKLQSIDINVAEPLQRLDETVEAEAASEAIPQLSAQETLREKLARMEADVQNLPDTQEKAEIQRTFSAFTAEVEKFVATDVALEDFAESIDNYYISRANLGTAWEEFSKAVEFGRNVNVDSKEYIALDAALDDLGDDLAASFSEQSASCVVYQAYADSIAQNLSRGPIKPAFLTWNGNVNAAESLKTLLAGYPYNRHALDTVRLALNANGRGSEHWAAYRNSTEVKNAYDGTRDLLKALYAVKSGTNPMTEKSVRDALKYLTALGKAIELNATRAENIAAPEDAREEENTADPTVANLAAKPQQTAEDGETNADVVADTATDTATDAAAEGDKKEELRKELHAKIKELFDIDGRTRNLVNLELLRLRAMPDFSETSLKRLINYVQIITNRDDRLEARKAIKTLGSIWFTPFTGRDNSEEVKAAWSTVKKTIDDERDARHFGIESLNLRDDLVYATRSLCKKAGITEEREVSNVVFSALRSAAAGHDLQNRKGRLSDLSDYIKSVTESAPQDEEGRVAHFAAAVTTLRNLGKEETRYETEAAVARTVSAYKQAKRDAAVKAEMETLTASLDELFAGRYDRDTVPAAELQKYCKTPDQIHRINRYIDSALSDRNDAKIKDTIETLKAVVSGEVQDRLAALSRIKAHVQALDETESLDVGVKSMAARMAAPADAQPQRRDPVLTTTGARTDADLEPDMVAALDTARGPAAGTRRIPSLDDGVNARRTHIEEELRPEIGGDIDASHAYEAGQEPAGGWKDSWLWKAAQAAGRRWPTIAVGIGTGFYVKGALVATAVTPIGPFLAAVAASAFVGYAIGGQISYHYMRRLDGNEAYTNGEQGFFRNRATELAAGLVAVTQFIAHTGKIYEFGTGSKLTGLAKGFGKNTVLATVIALPSMLYVIPASIRKTYIDNKGEKIGLLSRIGQTLGNMKQIGGLYTEMMIGGLGGAVGGAAGAALNDLDAATGGNVRSAIGNTVAWVDSRTGIGNGLASLKQNLIEGISTVRQGVGGIWKAASMGDVPDFATVFGGNALIGEFLTNPEFLRARSILENIAAGDTSPTGDLGKRITGLLAALDKRDAASLPALAELLEKLAGEGGEKQLAHALGESALAKFAGIADPAFADGKTALTDVTARIKAEIDAAAALRASARLAAADVTAVTDALPRITALTRVDQIVAGLANGADKTALTDALRDLRAGKIGASTTVIERLAAMNRGGLATELRNQLVTQLEGKLGVGANKDVITRLKGMRIAVNPAAEAIADATTTSERFAAFIKNDAGMQRILDRLQDAMDKAPNAATKAHLRSILENVRGPRPNPALVLGAIDTYAEWMKFNANGTYSPLAGRPEGLPSLEDRRAFAQTVRASMREHLLTATEGDAKAQKYLKLAGENRMPTDAQRIGSITVAHVNPVNLAETLSARGYTVVSGTGDRIIISVPRGESARLPIIGELNPTFAKTFGMASATDSIQYPVRIWPTDTLIGKVANSIQLAQIRGGFSPVEFDLIVDQAQQGDKASLARLKTMAETTLGGNRDNRALLAELRKLETPQPRLRR